MCGCGRGGEKRTFQRDRWHEMSKNLLNVDIFEIHSFVTVSLKCKIIVNFDSLPLSLGLTSYRRLNDETGQDRITSRSP